MIISDDLLLKALNITAAPAHDVVVVKAICAILFHVPTMLVQGIHHQTTLLCGKPPFHKTKNKMSCKPPIVSKVIVPISASESLRSFFVLFDAAQ